MISSNGAETMNSLVIFPGNKGDLLVSINFHPSDLQPNALSDSLRKLAEQCK